MAVIGNSGTVGVGVGAGVGVLLGFMWGFEFWTVKEKGVEVLLSSECPKSKFALITNSW
jgi:hypothetical protein